ncbi:hypothetical protein J6590_019653, partial [Homalodisca vitripennis]
MLAPHPQTNRSFSGSFHSSDLALHICGTCGEISALRLHAELPQGAFTDAGPTV